MRPSSFIQVYKTPAFQPGSFFAQEAEFEEQWHKLAGKEPDETAPHGRRYPVGSRRLMKQGGSNGPCKRGLIWQRLHGAR